MTANESKNLSEKQKQQIVCEYARQLRTNLNYKTKNILKSALFNLN